MAREEKRLTALEVMKAGEGLYCDGGGLWLQVTVGADGKPNRSWLYRFMSPETRRERLMGLGSIDHVSLAEAREQRDRARKTVQVDKKDPIEERARERARALAGAQLAKAKGMTFDDAARAYFADHQSSWGSDRHKAQFLNSLRDYASPTFGAVPVGAVDVATVVKALKPIWVTKPETARRVRNRIESICDWATALGYRSGDNPARLGVLKYLLPKRSKLECVKHHAALPYADVPALMSRLAQENSRATAALRFLILTAARAGEIRGARWDEIDLGARVWTIPASRMKAKREHRIPLSDGALAVLEQTSGPGRLQMGFVFPGAIADVINDIAMQMVLKRLAPGATVHGFRSSFRDWCGEETHFPREIAEAALAHVAGDATERAYRRGDALAKRRELMEAWSRFCCGSGATS